MCIGLPCRAHTDQVILHLLLNFLYHPSLLFHFLVKTFKNTWVNVTTPFCLLHLIAKLVKSSALLSQLCSIGLQLTVFLLQLADCLFLCFGIRPVHI
jgi:hypothetical protein